MLDVAIGILLNLVDLDHMTYSPVPSGISWDGVVAPWNRSCPGLIGMQRLDLLNHRLDPVLRLVTAGGLLDRMPEVPR